jgi:transposase
MAMKVEERMGYISGESRDQVTMFPEVVDDYITEDNPVRFVEAFVDGLDMTELGFGRAEPKDLGRPGYDPRDLLKLYIYGYLNRVRTSRRMEIEAGRNLELMWLMSKLKPDFKTIADFRKENTKALKGIFKEFVVICKKLELFGGELLAVDGSKFRASNSRKKNFSAAKLKDLINKTDKRIDDYLKQLDQGDTEDEANRVPVEALNNKIERLKEIREGYKETEQKLAKSGEKQISLTDPDARLMKSVQGMHVSYNVQMAVDSKHKMIVAMELTNEGNDLHQLSEVAKQAKEELGVEEIEVVTDMGYYDCDQVKECADNGITAYMSKPAVKVIEGVYSKDRFEYNADKDVYVCPAGEDLRYRTTDKQNSMRLYKTDSCESCPQKKQCTTGEGSRAIKRHIHEGVMEEMATRVKGNRDKLRLRGGLVEHPWGTMKRSLDQGYFLLRGNEKVGTEMRLTGLIYNMKRAFNIVGIPKLIEALG